ncbi:hypothetical protein [Cephaloticoccus primus]|uniref:LPD3 domain-containing protein n=1 Tax=Cephaloticoccus primus TaxID=1548207 RepID=UPI0012E721CD|nr:hypothetical protein [Cephaloticoccus primus]
MSAHRISAGFDRLFRDGSADVLGGYPRLSGAYDAAQAEGRTKLGYGQWLSVRTPEFRQQFGDWEALRAQQKLDAMEPVSIAVPEGWEAMSREQWRSEMVGRLELLMEDKANGRSATPIVHPELGEIFVNRDGINKTKSASADPAKILVAAHVKDVLPQAIYAYSRPLNKPKRDVRIEGYATLYAKVEVGGVPLIAVFTVERKTDGKWYYNTVMRLAASEDEKTRKFQIGGMTGKPVQGTPLAGLAEGKRDVLRRVKAESVSQAVDPDTGAPVAQLTGKEFARAPGALADRVAKWYAKNKVSKVEVEGVGPVSLDRRAVQNSISHGLGRAKVVAFAAVPNILRKGRIVHEESLRGTRDGDYIHIAAPVHIAGEPHIVDVDVKADRNGSRMYLHDVEAREVLRLSAYASEGTPRGGDVASSTTEQQSASADAGVVETCCGLSSLSRPI